MAMILLYLAFILMKKFIYYWNQNLKLNSKVFVISPYTFKYA